MYPSINSGGVSPTLHTTVMAPSTSGTGSSAPVPGNDVRVRVVIDTAFRSEPPVELTGIAEIPNSSNFQFDFDYEKAILLNDEDADKPVNSAASVGVHIRDEFISTVSSYEDMGFSHEAATMAVAMHGFGAGIQDQVIDFCKSFQKLKEMGFEAHEIAGALLMNKNDLQAASEQLMSAS
uniref:UBA domain-containing protein n=2 Tax=Tetraselmis sp. GSL018 TaxID=582737 RepID=A0A061SCB9_9CHLO|mmetsp:Transcript_26652/g.63168  ORF Transcript_26652/g.63168 Transcript_26652/m.63168 type:complete len:179 (+) Transcript_26652:144-680(+)